MYIANLVHDNDGVEMNTLAMLNGDNDKVGMINSTPQVCLFDIDSGTQNLLQEKLFNCTSGSVGSYVDVPKKQGYQSLLQPDQFVPEDLHEYDVVVLDLGAKNLTSLNQNVLEKKGAIAGNTPFALLSRYPQQVFNSKPFGVNSIRPILNTLLKKEKVVIIFSDAAVVEEYEIVRIGFEKNQVEDRRSFSNMHVYDGMPSYKNKIGRKLKLLSEETKISIFLAKYLPGTEYRVEFDHPLVRENDAVVPSSNFVPLILNEDGHVVSFFQSVSGGFVFMFPQFADKEGFLLELLTGYLPEFCPELFPHNGQFGWLDDGSYPLPGEAELIRERVQIESKYKLDLAGNENSIAALKVEFGFLRELVSATGDDLVKAISFYLEWLGFESVVNMDEHSSVIFEEDIQVDCSDCLLVIEVKGIGGTSTDKQCSQISKIKYRRCEERGRFDVYALYIVNHQRYLSPGKRVNPPFTKEQINDAVLDKRGLLTTYDLYKAYFLVMEGMLEKSYVRDRLFDVGLVNLSPSGFKSLGVVHEVFKGGEVGIVILDGAVLEVGMRLAAKKGDNYTMHSVIELQLDGVKVQRVEQGEVGVKFDSAIKQKVELFVISQSVTQV